MYLWKFIVNFEPALKQPYRKAFCYDSVLDVEAAKKDGVNLIDHNGQVFEGQMGTMKDTGKNKTNNWEPKCLFF